MTKFGHPVEEILPVHDVQLRIYLQDGKSLKAVYGIPGMKKVKYEVNDHFVEVHIPQLELYEGIVVEYE